MKIFKNVDEKLSDLGFVLTTKEHHYLSYEKYNAHFDYVHRIDFVYKSNGKHIIQSYEKNNKNCSKCDRMVGLTKEELRLCVKKLKSLKWE